MKALQGIEGSVEWVERPALSCDVGQIRIRVAAAGLNRADLLQRAGLYPPPPGASDVLGLECAGVVSEVGAGSHWQVGDRVCALLAGGGMAEEVVIDGRHVLPVPEGLSLVEAAVLPEVYATAWLNLFKLGALKAGEKVLIHAGASGVGSAGIQLCKAFGNPCWVSVGSPERLAYCESLGAQGGVLRTQDLEGLRDFAPFDVILDPIGARYAALDLDVLARDGRWVIIGLMGGREAQLDLAKLLGKRVQLIGSTLRNRDDAFKGELIDELRRQVWPLFAEKRLDPRLEHSFAAKDVGAAFEMLASNTVSGKVALVIDDSLV
ncbi:NAD(P)H-quinone oxidoreductase [Azotobacter chroococcum]|jgi:putative PIG3 family NAD(P)H quinone oxidoreductase|uniref:Putative PIG3 family NAD(P)H quinone oxidoreductase n=1 Tax=Azotobacter chroococcum TaxID=353 RepID=A0A4R1PWQ6_9GAMM|nr:zinc-binding dehydrogenase [Azotobacter chroococcum]NHN77607.1 zinc-binding dehydrogenase [Azotobacter chroococcum]TBV91227.1 NAD(P)H-quinone oxidoreductase [Azotobacter chroococcum]TBW10438.1 NAD(P)H-quinone oxidoreductase [Azotobacter chroococcum subsp. isscasi]TBW37779.1 NAD(P)H-quinone oxidoreductase [Azotobacter chroococcum]TCL32630.1 putative PIG3 family NAD(P)H quinone oxidoreductase [Azotobacter chroococcum]